MSYAIFFSNFLSYPKQINKRGKLSCMRAKLCNFLSNSLEQIDWVQVRWRCTRRRRRRRRGERERWIGSKIGKKNSQRILNIVQSGNTKGEAVCLWGLIWGVLRVVPSLSSITGPDVARHFFVPSPLTAPVSTHTPSHCCSCLTWLALRARVTTPTRFFAFFTEYQLKNNHNICHTD